MYVAKYALYCHGRQLGIADTRAQAQGKVREYSERYGQRIRVHNLKGRVK